MRNVTIDVCTVDGGSSCTMPVDGPRPVAPDLLALGDGDGAILMSTEGPVAGIGLVEEQGAHRPHAVAEMAGGDGADHAVPVEQAAESGHVAEASAGALSRNTRESTEVRQDCRGSTAMVLEAALDEH